jgi:hypothetical protein
MLFLDGNLWNKNIFLMTIQVPPTFFEMKKNLVVNEIHPIHGVI